MQFQFLNRVLASHITFIKRSYSSMNSSKKGLVVGCFCSKSKNELKLTKFGQKKNEESGNKIMENLKLLDNGMLSKGETRVFYGVGDFPCVAVTGIESETSDPLEHINIENENVRNAACNSFKALASLKLTDVYFDNFDKFTRSAAEGAYLSAYKFQEYKEESKRTKIPNIHLAEGTENQAEWERGKILAEAQNFARVLMETPANLMTPTIFVETVMKKYQGLPNIEVIAHDEDWARQNKMGCFLSVTNGSAEPAKFLEIKYNGGKKDSKPVALVGKGITFDSGGISIKPSAKMDQMRGDMGGAANVVSCIYGLSKLGVPVNVVGLVPLCENMPGSRATKPGDVFFARNGKSVCVDNTDAEGRLILADALCYAHDFNPKCIVDLATLTGAIKVALGDCLTGLFTNNEVMWQKFHEASVETGDRVWRMPLLKHYTSQMTDHDSYDLNNLGKGKGGGSCTAAAFLREFVDKDMPWTHLDIAAVMCDTSDQKYIGAAMSGRPVRTLIEYVIKESN